MNFSKSFPGRLILLFVGTILFLSCTSEEFRDQSIPVADTGVIDLSNWNFNEQGTVLLNGDWELYWNQLYSNSDIESMEQVSKKYYPVPRVWNEYQVDDQVLGGNGYATFRLKIILPELNKTYGFKINDIITAYKMEANGTEIARNGVVGRSRSESYPQLRPQVVFYQPDGKTIELIMQVSNYFHARGGFYNGIEFGLAEQIRTKREIAVIYEASLFGCIMIICLYHLGLFLLRRQDRYTLWFCLICLVVGIRILITGEYLLVNYLPSMTWFMVAHFSYLTAYMLAALFGIFLRELYPDEYSEKFLRGLLLVCLVLSAIVLILPTHIFTNTIFYFYLVAVTSCLYSVYILIRANRSGRTGAGWFMIGMIVFVLTVFNDILHYNRIIHSIPMIPFGLFVFILTQSLVLSKTFSAAYGRIEKLEKKFRSLFEDSLDAILVTTTGGRILDINEAGLDLFGYTREELPKLNVGDSYVNETDREKFLTELMQTGYVKNFQAEFYGKDRKKVICNVTSTIRTDREGRRQLQSVVHDITELEKAKERTEQALKKAEIANEAKSLFLANTSHELKTPLQGIIGIAESLLENQQVPDRQEEVKSDLGLIVNSGKRLSNLVNDILDFSELKARGLELNQKPVDLKALIKVVLKLMSTVKHGKQLEIKTSIPGKLPYIYADEDRLQQVLFNLIGNAIKFTHEGSISIQAELKDSFVEISIADTGIGIPEDKQDSIFHSFEQVDASTSREYGGAGLGLAITRELVELHGGKISVNSVLDEGSSFTITLPITDKKPEQELADTVSRIEIDEDDESYYEPVSREKAIYNILIVDDEPINQRVLLRHLTAENYNIIQVFNGKQALDEIDKNGQFDLILLDIMMPRMSGFEVCKRIREKYMPNELPVIMLTAKNQVSDLVEGFSSGANDYISKPFSKSELMARISTQLNLLKINSAYERFVPQEFLKTLGRESIIDVRLGDQIKGEMTVLFSDIRSFTSLSEEMTPQQNFEFLNNYLQNIIPSISRNNGFIDKYIGDAVMALFPHKPEDAIKASIDALEAIAAYNSHRKKKGDVPVEIGVGLHTGPLMLGTIGNEDRMDGTVISDAVNLASRLEGLTKLYGSSILVSKDTLFGIEHMDQYHYRFLGKERVKGKVGTVSIYEIYNGDPENIIDLKLQSAADFELGMKHYFNRDFADAVMMFKNVLKVNPDDKSAALYLERSAEYVVKDVPDNWEGI